MKNHFICLIIFLALSSCAKNEVEVERGIVRSKGYVNSSLGLAIDFPKEEFRVFGLDSSNQAVPFEILVSDQIVVRGLKQEFLIGFHHSQPDYNITINLINHHKVRTGEMKEYLFTKVENALWTGGNEPIITSSDIKEFDVNGKQFEYFEANYSIKGKSYVQNSMYAYTSVKGVIVLIDITFANRKNTNVNEEVFQNFLKYIHFE